MTKHLFVRNPHFILFFNMDCTIEKLCTIEDIEKFMKKNVEKGHICYSLKGEILYGICFLDDECVICYSTNPNGAVQAVIMKQQQLIRMHRKTSEEEIVIDGKTKINNDIIDLNAEGERWEGDCYFGMPCGWGMLMNNDNVCIYKGFHVGCMHWGFGTQYYSHSVSPQYEGYWCNGVKIGKGMKYDCEGQIIFEGEYINDSLPITKYHLPKEVEVPTFMSSLQSIKIEKHSYKTTYDFCLDSLPNLESLEVGFNCFSTKMYKHYMDYKNYTPEEEELFGSFCIRSCPKLCKLDILPISFNNMLSCEFSDLPKLESLRIHSKSFFACHYLTIRGSKRCYFSYRNEITQNNSH